MIKYIKTEGRELNENSLRHVRLIGDAAQLLGPWDGMKNRPLPREEVDAVFEAIHESLRAFESAADYVVASQALDALWSLVFAHAVVRDPAVNYAQIQQASFIAQIKACWACGDADKI